MFRKGRHQKEVAAGFRVSEHKGEGFGGLEDGVDSRTYILACQECRNFACQLLDSYPVSPPDMASGRQPNLDYYRCCRRWIHLWTVYPANGVKFNVQCIINNV